MMILARKLIVLLFICLPVILHARGCLRSVIIADTLDQKIGYTCVSDAYRLKKSLYSICSQLNLKPDITILDKKKCRSVDLVRWLGSQNPISTDVVMLLYSGHGDEDPSRGSLPLLALQDVDLPGSVLQEAMEKFHCKLSVLCLDCCNGSGEEARSNRKSFHPVIHRDQRLPGLKHLFCGTRANIVICAASVGEVAWGTDGKWRPGGYLTTGFLLAMKELTGEPKGNCS